MEERRTNLKEIYKFVRTCRGCSKNYGSDYGKEVMAGYCPQCLCSTNGHSGGLRRYARLFREPKEKPPQNKANGFKSIQLKGGSL